MMEQAWNDGAWKDGATPNLLERLSRTQTRPPAVHSHLTGYSCPRVWVACRLWRLVHREIFDKIR